MSELFIWYAVCFRPMSFRKKTVMANWSESICSLPLHQVKILRLHYHNAYELLVTWPCEIGRSLTRKGSARISWPCEKGGSHTRGGSARKRLGQLRLLVSRFPRKACCGCLFIWVSETKFHTYFGCMLSIFLFMFHCEAFFPFFIGIWYRGPYFRLQESVPCFLHIQATDVTPRTMT